MTPVLRLDAWGIAMAQRHIQQYRAAEARGIQLMPINRLATTRTT